MNATIRRKLEMAARVRDFIRAHPAEGASEGPLSRLEALLRRAEEQAAQQRAGLIEVSVASARRAELRRALQYRLLRHLVKVGVVAAKGRGPTMPGSAPRRRSSSVRIRITWPFTNCA